ncbi:Ku protein [Streptomyces sp. NPDC056930]|uniref:Ku protein n=1 Tax=Streptomyces sp. NPDC056930 TaxID=3345967 RepID=UPI00363C687A
MTGKLVEALARTGFVGVSKIAIMSRERLALLRPRHGVLVVQTPLWADELRDPVISLRPRPSQTGSSNSLRR